MSKMIVWIIAGIVAYIAMPILIMVTVVAIWYWCTAYIANSILKEDEDEQIEGYAYICYSVMDCNDPYTFNCNECIASNVSSSSMDDDQTYIASIQGME